MIDFSTKKVVVNAVHYVSEINQLYRSSAKFKPDSQDLVYSYKNINSTKFAPILLKEWFYTVKVGGYLLIDYQPNNLVDFKKLEYLMWWLWKDRYQIIFHKPIAQSETSKLSKVKLQNFIEMSTSMDTPAITQLVPTGNGYLRFIIKKTKSTQIPEDDIDKWTFGVVTKGLRNDWIKEFIDSVRRQKIPHYEIIICGLYNEKTDKDTKVVTFEERDDLIWLSKKKNLIIKHANFENILITHDRMYLDKDWYKGMKKWGNYFEHLNCSQYYQDQRLNDWVVRHMEVKFPNNFNFGYASYSEYIDWYPSIRIPGQLDLFKKSLVEKYDLWWDESLYYNDGLDSPFSLNFHKFGFIERINPYAIVKSQTYKEPNPTFIRFNPTNYSPILEFDNIYAYLKFFTYWVFKILNFFHLLPPIDWAFYLRNKIYYLSIRFSKSRYSDYKEWEKTTLNLGKK